MKTIRPLLLLLALAATPAAHAEYITDKLLVGFLEAPDAQAKVIRLLPSATPVEVRDQVQGDFTQIRLSEGAEGWVETRYLTDEKPARSLVVELQAANADLQRRVTQAPAAQPDDAASTDARTESRRIAELESLRSEARDLKRRLSETELAIRTENAALKAEIERLRQARANSSASAPVAGVAGDAAGNVTGELQRLQAENADLRQRIQAAAAALGAGGLNIAPPRGIQPLHLLIVAAALIVFFFVGFTFRGWLFSRRYPGFRV